jgi:hypothetical protein
MFKNKKKSIVIVLALSAVFSASAYATSSQCSYAAQLKCMMGFSEYCSVRCEIN